MTSPIEVVVLPATAPDEVGFGRMPQRLPSPWRCRQVHFDRQVWYNAAIRAETLRQIRAWGLTRCLLVGFSKSGLGALLLALEAPDLVAGVVVFDAPLAAPRPRPGWGADAFYEDPASWQADLPLNRCPDLAAAIRAGLRVALLNGALYAADHAACSGALAKAGTPVLRPQPPAADHRWDAGWIIAGLKALSAGGPAR